MLLLGGRVAIAGAFAFLAAQACGSDEATPATPIASDGGDPGQPSSGDGSTACKSNCESADAQPPSGDCTAAMVSAAPFAGGDGSPSSPFQICSVAQWLRINDGLAKSYVLLTDLDFVANPVEGESLEEVRVGHQNGFSGTLDGKGHTIKNLRITGAVSMPQGLFTQISASGDVRNIGITDAVVTSTYADAGILAGRLTGKATNVHVTGKVKGTSQVGGLAGSVDGTVEGASSVADVEGTDSVGGLVGYFGGVALRRSSSAGVVKGTGTSIQNNGPATGGLVGTHRGGPIQDTYSIATVTGLTVVGGLVGSMYGVGSALVLERSYFAGTVTLGVNAASTYKGLGGLVGVAINKTKISQCFAAGEVVSLAVQKGGGLVGEPGDLLVDDYWDISRSKANNCAPSLVVAGCTGTNASNAEPAHFFATSSPPLSTWDFTTVWSANPNDFPTLR